jgi:hypothetical protein
MTIRYQNGRSFEAITLSRGQDVIRVVMRGTEDVTTLTCRNGTWVTDDCEPVTIEHSSRQASACVSEADCICPAALAAQLLGLLYRDSSEDLPRFPKVAIDRDACEAQP